jgi:tripartite-type tricarboxylate transporter receptor subunit TctC
MQNLFALSVACAVFSSLFCMLTALPCAAQSPYPAKPIRFIVPFAPGGGTDIVARVLAQRLNESWGRAVIVDNRPGAGSTLGTDLAAKAAPDGYTLLLSSISIAFNASLYKTLPFDSQRDLAPVTLVAIQPNMLVTNPRVPVLSLKDLLVLAKQKPGSIRYASGGNGSGPHLATELLKLAAGIELGHVPYRGTGPALTDLLAGQVDVMIAVTASALPHVRGGKLRALAVTGDRRSAVAPEIPTVSESGVPGYEFKTWYGIQVPAKTPGRIIDELNQRVSDILARPDVVEQFGAGGLEARASSPREFGALIDFEITKWAKVVKASGARID